MEAQARPIAPVPTSTKPKVVRKMSRKPVFDQEWSVINKRPARKMANFRVAAVLERDIRSMSRFRADASILYPPRLDS
jgi:hypothetical protein